MHPRSELGDDRLAAAPAEPEIDADQLVERKPGCPRDIDPWPLVGPPGRGRQLVEVRRELVKEADDRRLDAIEDVEEATQVGDERRLVRPERLVVGGDVLDPPIELL